MSQAATQPRLPRTISSQRVAEALQNRLAQQFASAAEILRLPAPNQPFDKDRRQVLEKQQQEINCSSRVVEQTVERPLFQVKRHERMQQHEEER